MSQPVHLTRLELSPLLLGRHPRFALAPRDCYALLSQLSPVAEISLCVGLHIALAAQGTVPQTSQA